MIKDGQPLPSTHTPMYTVSFSNLFFFPHALYQIDSACFLMACSICFCFQVLDCRSYLCLPASLFFHALKERKGDKSDYSP